MEMWYHFVAVFKIFDNVLMFQSLCTNKRVKGVINRMKQFRGKAGPKIDNPY